MVVSNTIRHLFITKFSNPKYHKKVEKRDILIFQGEISNSIFFIQSGIVRIWHNDGKGRDITLQFFEANQIVSSFESFYLQVPSNFSIEVIESGEVLKIPRDVFLQNTKENDVLQEEFVKYICNRFIDYTNLFLSRIKYSPKQRYKELCENHPRMIEKIPNHYIASYLGITAVSLSRIKHSGILESL